MTHRFADAQETPTRPELAAPRGHETRADRHAEPFHSSVNPVNPLPPEPRPTATQFAADVHQTPLSSACSRPAGGRAALSRQVRPFQESMRTELPAVVADLPTATQYVADGQDTALRSPSTLSAGAGGVAVVHLPPFHDSATAAAPPPLKYSPTATQRLTDAQETPFKMTPVPPAGVGSVLGVHVRPFQVSASGIPAPALSR